MEEIIKQINNTNASFRDVTAGDAKNTDLFLDKECQSYFEGASSIQVRFNKQNLTQAILFIASILPRKYDNSTQHFIQPFSNDFILDQLTKIEGYFAGADTKIESWTIRTDVPKKNGTIDERLYFNDLIKTFNYCDSTGQTISAKYTIRDFLAGGYSSIHIKKGNDGIYNVWITNTTENFMDNTTEDIETQIASDNILQQIYYGAPGTGKSHTIKEVTDGQPKENVFRTTFHPDSDYSTFVGAYKPTKIKKIVRDMAGKPALDEKKNEIYEDAITYKFVPQAFLKAYIRAWNVPNEKVYLVIEEINRGNCAQIFGDLFQLLDRKDGVSEYPIKADEDLLRYLTEGKDDEGNDILTNKEGIANDELRLPSNLYIWATMNTSDQSLFPIDSAFKRRWNWEYVKIADACKGWQIEGLGKDSWYAFIEQINKVIAQVTNSADKQLGYFFCKPDVADNTISLKRFVNKVVFYLWNDVFKDYAFAEKGLFEDTKGQAITFPDFYDDADGINQDITRAFISNVLCWGQSEDEKQKTLEKYDLGGKQDENISAE